MARSSIPVEQLASEIMRGMEEYAGAVTEDVKEAVKKTAQDVRKEIKANAPRDTGDYAKSWASKKTKETSGLVTYTVHSKDRYQIAHLLEKGHAKRGGGRVAARPHIAPAEEHGVRELERLIKDSIG